MIGTYGLTRNRVQILHVALLWLRCVKLWSSTTYKVLASLPHSTPLTSLLLSKLLLVTACQSGSIKLWSLTAYARRVPLGQAQLPSSAEEDPLVTQWQLEDDVYLTDMVLEGDKIFACGRWAKTRKQITYLSVSVLWNQTQWLCDV